MWRWERKHSTEKVSQQVGRTSLKKIVGGPVPRPACSATHPDGHSVAQWLSGSVAQWNWDGQRQTGTGRDCRRHFVIYINVIFATTYSIRTVLYCSVENTHTLNSFIAFCSISLSSARLLQTVPLGLPHPCMPGCVAVALAVARCAHHCTCRPFHTSSFPRNEVRKALPTPKEGTTDRDAVHALSSHTQEPWPTLQTQ